jgi:hypothetical protein
LARGSCANAGRSRAITWSALAALLSRLQRMKSLAWFDVSRRRRNATT